MNSSLWLLEICVNTGMDLYFILMAIFVFTKWTLSLSLSLYCIDGSSFSTKICNQIHEQR